VRQSEEVVGQTYSHLVDSSLSAALASIETYNKPNFAYREEVFTILIVNAWELLLKAKILKDANDDITSIYVSDKKGSYKLSRNGANLTIEILGAMGRVGLAAPIAKNIEALVEIRDTVVHFYHNQSLSYLLYTLGAASLQNYQRLIGSWFDKSLTDYNFYIMPLGFAYNFKTLSLLELAKEPESIANLIKSAISTQAAIEESDQFYFVCEIAAQVKKMVPFVEKEADLSVSIDPKATTTDKLIIHRTIPLTDQYPFSYRELCERVKKERPYTKQGAIDKVIRDHHMKENPKMSAYNFRTKTHKDHYEKTKILPSGMPTIYNENAIRFIVAHLPVDLGLQGEVVQCEAMTVSSS
jgi:hypothetical protein